MSGPKTRVEPVQKKLRGEILSGHLMPGSKLPLAELAERFGISVGVMREALIRLTTEGLVVAEPQLGFRVVSVSDEDLQELLEARLLIECEVFRSAIENGSVEWEIEVIAAYHRMQRVELDPEGNRNEEAWVAAHREFHRALLSGCPNRRLVSVAMSLRDAAELYRTTSVQAMADDHSKRRDEEHLMLRDAAVERDATRGPKLLGDHLLGTARYFHLVEQAEGVV